MRANKAVVGIILCGILPAYGQTCSDFIVLDRYSSTTDYKTYERTKDVLCSQEIHESSSGRSVGIKAGIPIPVMDDVFSLKFDGNYASNDWSKWQSGFCHSNYYDSATQLKNSNMSSVFGTNSADVVKACLQREPVYGYYEVAPDGTAFTFTFSVQGKDKLRRAVMKPADAVSSCSSDYPSENPFNVSWMDLHVTDLDISAQKKSFSCKWNSKQTVGLTITLANQGDRSFILPSIVKRDTPPPPPKPTPVVMLTSETYRLNHTSGNGHDWGSEATLCSPEKPAGWTIQDVSFHLEGDRQCGAWAECKGGPTDSPVKACRIFRMQGHDEAKPGVRESMGVLTVVWQHTEMIMPGK